MTPTPPANATADATATASGATARAPARAATPLRAYAAAPTYYAAEAGEPVHLALPKSDWHPGQPLELYLTDRHGLPGEKKLRLTVLGKSTVHWATHTVGLVLEAQRHGVGG